MAILGPKTAIVSLGISCQTTRQIENNLERLARKLGEPLELKRMPFDWRINGPDSVREMLAAREFYPPDAAEMGKDRRRYWARRRSWFWHDKWDDFRSFQAKQAHLVDNWKFLSKTSRQVFVVSNIQNDLREKAKEHGGFEIPVSLEAMFALLAQLEAMFSAPELHLVTRADLVIDLGRFGFKGLPDRQHAIKVRDLARGPVTVHRVAPDRSGWQGPSRDWVVILDRIVFPTPLAKARRRAG